MKVKATRCSWRWSVHQGKTSVFSWYSSHFYSLWQLSFKSHWNRLRDTIFTLIKFSIWRPSHGSALRPWDSSLSSQHQRALWAAPWTLCSWKLAGCRLSLQYRGFWKLRSRTIGRHSCCSASTWKHHSWPFPWMPQSQGRRSLPTSCQLMCWKLASGKLPRASHKVGHRCRIRPRRTL